MIEKKFHYHFRLIQTTFVISSIVYLVLGFTACKTRGTGLPFTTIEQNKFSSFTAHQYSYKAPGLALITQLEDVTNLDGWVANDSQEKLNELDYTRNFALAVFQGEKGSGGFGVQITRIVQREDTVSVYAQFTEARVDELHAAALTSPYHLVKIEKVAKWGQEITFQVIVNGKVVVSSRHFIP